MKVNLACKNILMSAILAAGIVVSGSASAALIDNEDFGTGFTSWSGLISSIDTNPLSPTVGDEFFPFTGDFGAFTNNFEISPTNEVTLSTSGVLEVQDNFEVILFQLFDVENLTAGNTALSISLDFSSILGIDTETWAFLTDDVGNILEDLTGGGSHDITGLAGQNDVVLEFGVIDYDLIGPSSLTVSNIMFTQSGSMPPTSVPEPSTLLLFAVSLFAVRNSRLIAK